MIYLITGTPGSGKTLYAVSTTLQKLAAEEITTPDGEIIKRRLVVDGIRALLLPHDLMAKLVQNQAGEWVPEDIEAHGVWNWFEWCKPGDVIVIDEVQRHWRPRGMNTKPHPSVQLLETHRHYGVDFVIITQNPMLLDQNIRRLVGRHQNIRRLWGMGRCVVYDWDGCQTNINSTKGSAISFFTYKKKDFELYHSAELHTKQRQKFPLILWLPIISLVFLIYLFPRISTLFTNLTSGKPIPSAAAPQSSGASGSPSSPQSTPKPPAIAGCVTSGTTCTCFDAAGARASFDPSRCLVKPK
jgi:zona occludens toxin